jgi:hypothetical protein
MYHNHVIGRGLFEKIAGGITTEINRVAPNAVIFSQPQAGGPWIIAIQPDARS